MLSKSEKQFVCRRVEQDLVDAFTRAKEFGVRLEFLDFSSYGCLKVLDADIDKPFVDSVLRALCYFTGSFGVMQGLISCRMSDFVRAVCKKHLFELVERGC